MLQSANAPCRALHTRLYIACEEAFMLLSVRNLSKSYGHLTILSDLTFAVNAGERMGLYP